MQTLRIFVSDVIQMGVEKLQPVWTIAYIPSWYVNYFGEIVERWTPSLARAPGLREILIFHYKKD